MLTHECKGNASYKHLSIKQENIDLYYKNKPRTYATVPFSLGYYILKETVDGKTEVDLHTPSLVFNNLLASSPGGTISGKPVSMGLIFQYCHIDNKTAEYVIPPALALCTEDNVRIINLNDFTTIFTYDDMFYGDKPQRERPLYIS